MDQRCWDADDFADRTLRRVGGGAFGELDTHQGLHVVFQAGVVNLRDSDHRPVDRGPIESAPFAVVGADPVGDQYVGVQVRIPGPAVAVRELSGHDALHIDLAHTIATQPREHRVLFEPAECVAHRTLVRELDLLPDGPRGESP